MKSSIPPFEHDWLETLRNEIINELGTTEDVQDDSLSVEQMQIFSRNNEHYIQLNQQLKNWLPQGRRVSPEVGETIELCENGELLVGVLMQGSGFLEGRTSTSPELHILEAVTTKTPIFAGLNMIGPQPYHMELIIRVISAGTEIELYPLETVRSVLTENIRWQTVAYLQAYSHSASRYMLKLQQNGKIYFIVKGYLESLKTRKEYTPLNEYNIIKLIVNRTGLSRSGVADIISVLNRRGYIHVEHGKLTFIGRLPDQLR